MYIIRDENGVLIGKIHEKIALDVISNSKGYWKTVKVNSKKIGFFGKVKDEVKEVNRFLFEEDMKIGNDGIISIYAWEGSTMEREEP